MQKIKRPSLKTLRAKERLQQQIDIRFHHLAFAAGVAMPIMTLPQLYTIWWDHVTAGVSWLTWAFYALISLIFTIFGIQNKQKLLIITYLPMFLIEVVIVVGLFVY